MPKSYLKRCKSKQSKAFRSFLYRYPLLSFLSLSICYSTDKFQIFYCFCGLSYSDVKNLTKDDLKTSFDGHLWIITRRQKTNTDSSVRLLEVPKRIIEKYRGYSRDNHIFPVPSNSACNNILKQIGKQCGIKTRLTYHVSRHTFGTLLTISQGVPIETVSRMMGHTNIKTTQIYAKITKEKISQDMEILSHKLESLERQITERI